jgi:hypothetical protein
MRRFRRRADRHRRRVRHLRHGGWRIHAAAPHVV